MPDTYLDGLYGDRPDSRPNPPDLASCEFDVDHQAEQIVRFATPMAIP
jgi:hypothetical protein